MSRKQKRTRARLWSMLLVLALLPGMFVGAFAGDGDYQEWLKDYDTYGYDPYEKYYDAWNVPSVLYVYTRHGEKAADNYVGLFKISVVSDDPSWVQTGASNLDKMYPPSENTPAPVIGPNRGTVIKDEGIPVYDEEGNIIGLRDPVEGEPGYVAPADDDYPIGPNRGTVVKDEGIPVYDEEGNIIGLRDPVEGEPGYVPPADEPDQYVQYFDDVPEDAWYAEAVNAMAATGLLHGYEDGTFRPDAPLTNAEWCTIVWNIVGTEMPIPDGDYVILNGPSMVNSKFYGQRTTHWGSVAIFMSQSYGYFISHAWTYTIDKDGNPLEFDHFLEDDPVERWQAVHSIVEMTKDGDGIYYTDDGTCYYTNTLVNNSQKDLNKKLLSLQKKNGAKTDWTLEQIPDLVTFRLNISLCYPVVEAYNMGIVHGVDEAGNFNPHGGLTRAEACQMLYNAHITAPRPIKSKSGGGLYG